MQKIVIKLMKYQEFAGNACQDLIFQRMGQDVFWLEIINFVLMEATLPMLDAKL